MTLRPRSLILLVTAAGGLLGETVIAAETHLMSPAGQPIAAQIAASRAAVIARQQDASHWEVTAVLHDSTGQVAAGQTITPNPPPVASPDGLTLLISQPDRGMTAADCSLRAAEYVRTLPSVQTPVAERVAYASAALESSDPLIAADAVATLSAFSVSELAAHREYFSAETIGRLFAMPEQPPEQAAFFALLLGLLDQRSAAADIRSRLLHDESSLGRGVDGLTAGYLLLSGDGGLVEIEQEIFLAESIDPSRTAAVLHGMALLRDAKLGPSRARLQQSALTCLFRRETADLAIGYLENGREWDATDQVIAFLAGTDNEKNLDRAVQVAGCRFLLQCRTAPEAAPKMRAAADATLERVAQIDADLFRRATLLAPPQPAGR